MNDSHREKILRVRAVHNEVRRLLLDEWDPIGVGDAVETQDEYDAYVGRVVGLIASGCGSFPIAQYLFDVETSLMGLTRVGAAIQLELLAQKLASLADQL